MCLLSKRCATKLAVTAMILVHADDLVICGTDSEGELFKKFSDTFSHDEALTATEKNPIAYCGFRIRRRRYSLGISHGRFRSAIKPIGVSAVLGSSAHLTTPLLLRKAIKGYLGSWIWMLQTRFDLAYGVTLIASSVEEVLAVRHLLVDFLKICASAYDILMRRDVTVWYHPCPASDVLPRLITFSDAWRNTLHVAPP